MSDHRLAMVPCRLGDEDAAEDPSWAFWKDGELMRHHC